MSNTRKNYLIVLILTLMVSFFAFGCENEIDVSDIYFTLADGEQIIMLVDDEIDLAQYVTIRPGNATNKAYIIESSNSNIVSVDNTKITAKANGSAQIKITSTQNPIKQDLMTIVVWENDVTLSAPANLQYDANAKMLSFNSVPNAESYTLKINNREINLGNSTSFKLDSAEYLDNVLNVQIKANAPTYTSALKTSTYSNALKVYQVGETGNLKVENAELMFNKTSQTSLAKIYYNGVLVDTTSQNGMLLNYLNESYAGGKLKIGVEMVLGEDAQSEIRNEHGNDVQFYSSGTKEIIIDVLALPELKLNSGILEWQKDANVEKYHVYFDNSLQPGSILGNSVNLNEESFLGLDDNDVHTIAIKPVAKSNTTNLGIVNAVSEIKVQKLEAPRIHLAANAVCWNDIENKSAYAFVLTSSNNQLVSSTNQATLDMTNYAAGSYTISVRAIADDDVIDNVHFLSSNATEFVFGKFAPMEKNITDYVLHLTNKGEDAAVALLDKGETYEIDISNKIEKIGEDYLINLKGMTFAAGEHTITLKKQFNESEKMLESAESEISFVQLEKVEDFALKNGTISANISNLNRENNAIFKIITTGSGLTTDLEVLASSYTFNTTDLAGANYLSAGNYISKIYVLGDGENTFAYRENGEIAECGNISFDVLAVPSLRVSDSAKTELSISNVNNAIYKIFDNGKEMPCESNSYTFELVEGEKKFAVQAIGDGENHLSSSVSDEISVSRLVSPTLSFNPETNVLTYVDINEDDIVASRVLTKDGQDFDYDFTSPLNLAGDTRFSISTLANVEVGGKFYLDSSVTSLDLTKLSAAVGVEVINNQLMIETLHDECLLEIEFVFENGTEKLKTSTDNGKVLKNDTYSLNYTYSNNAYTINLIDAQHNALMSGLLKEFDVVITLSKNDGKHINSNSASFENLNLVSISAESVVTAQGKTIIIEPSKHSQEYGLHVNIDDTDFVSNGEHKLVADTVELNYEFKDGKYIISLLDNKFDCLIPTLVAADGSEVNFEVKVKYTHSLEGVLSDLDSVYSNPQVITIFKALSLSRDGQNLTFVNAYPTFEAKNYILLIDDSITLSLDENNLSLEDGLFILDVETVFDKLGEHTSVHSVQVVTIDNANNLAIYNKGAKIYIAKNPTVVLSSNKNNNLSDNSTLIMFEKAEQPNILDRKYVLTLSAGLESKNKEFLDTSTNPTIRLDDEEFNSLVGEIEITAKVLASGTYIDGDKTIEIFNSQTSNKLTITRVSNDLGLAAENSILTWNAAVGAFGYEVYKVESGSHIMLNKEILKTTTFNLDMLGVETETELVVKAIGETEITTNSLYSESIKVNKLATPVIGVFEGKIVVSLTNSLLGLILDGKIDIEPYILNGTEQKTLAFDDFEVNSINRTLTIEAYNLLNYVGGGEIVKENLSFAIKAGESNQDENGVFYLSSASAELDVYGLFAPTNIRKMTDENNTIEQIIWSSNANNLISGTAIAEKYVFKLIYTDVNGNTFEYSSNDEKLVYKDTQNENNYLPYGVIAVGESNSQATITFPYGYDIGGAKEVIFDAGNYKFSVQAVPNIADSSVNLASSKFSSEFQFEIMPTVNVGVSAGDVCWDKLSGATSYVVYVTPNGETEARTFAINNDETLSTIKYNFSNLPTIQGVCKIQVKALSTKDNVLNSALSKPIYVYRLPQAKSIGIDDGHLVFEANKYFTSAVIEFFDTSSGVGRVTHTETYTNNDYEDNLEKLNLPESWEDITNDIENEINTNILYTIKLTSEGDILASNKNYKINIKLYGNTAGAGANNGFVSSVNFETVSNLTATKLGVSVVEVEKGAVTFGALENVSGLNYVLNATDNGEFWKEKAIIYRVDLKYGAENATFYALDYYAFIEEIAKPDCSISYTLFVDQTGSIEDYGDLYAIVFYAYGGKQLVFDVYRENTINLAQRDHFRYHYTEETNKDGINTLTTTLNTSEGNNGYNQIDIADYSSFTFNITILGGDSKIDENSSDMANPNIIGYISAFANNVRTINRYENNEISTLNGKVLFNNLTKFNNDVSIDTPIYKFVVKMLNSTDAEHIFYVYSTTKQEAQAVAALNGDENVEFVEIENIEDEPSKHLFDLTKYISEGTFNVTLQTLAGVTNQSDGNYIINAKLPSVGSMNKIIYKLYETEISTHNGVLKFNQSYTVNDGVRLYNNYYEVTVNDQLADYVFKIDPTTEGYYIDTSSHSITYDLPSQITTEDGQTLDLDEFGTYTLKIRALSGTMQGETGSMILNSTYKKSGEEDVVLLVRKTAVAQNVEVESGKLKWVVADIFNHNKTTIKITYQITQGQTISIEKTADINNAYFEGGVYQYHYLDSEDLGLIYRENGYSVSMIVSSAEAGMLNSNPTDEISLNVLQTVTSSSIKAQNGILVWDAIENATENTKYKVLIRNTGLQTETLEVVVDQNQLDLLNNEQTQNLAAGNYNIIIQAIAGEGDNLNINAENSAKVGGFIKLSAVDLNSIIIEDGVFKWGVVENAEKYQVVFNYNDSSMTPNEDSKIVDTASYTPPTGVAGSFSLTIWAIGLENEKLFNSNSTTYHSSTDAPNPVKSFSYDAELKNQFIIEVNDDFKNSDKLVLRYNLTQYTKGGGQENLGEQIVEINYVDGQTIYYSPITIMGLYENITVQVYRQNSIASERTAISGSINMDLFEYGGGIENEPYTINSAEQLLNIKYYSTNQAYFALGCSIDFRSFNIEEIISTNGGYLISETFNGTLSGGTVTQKNSIYGFNSTELDDKTFKETITLNAMYKFALFGKLDGATLSNINIGATNSKLIVSNMFALDLMNMIKLSVIAVEANNSTIDDVDFIYQSVEINLEINLPADDTDNLLNHKGIKIAAMFATAENTRILNSSTKLNISIVNNAESVLGGKVYLAGVVAQATDCEVKDVEVDVEMSCGGNFAVDHAGGAVAYFTSGGAISGAKVNVTMNNMYVLQFGGIVGYAQNLNIENSKVLGTYLQQSVNYNLTVGGVVGKAEDVNVVDCSNFMDFDINLTSTGTQQYIGIIAGNIYKQTISSSITNCVSHLFGKELQYQTETTPSSGNIKITLGIYGRQKDVAISGCHYAKKS